MLQASVFTDEISRDFDEAVQTAAGAGLRFVDIRNAWGKSVAHFDRADRDRMAETLRRHDVKLGVIQSPFGKCDIADEAYGTALDELSTMFEIAHDFGVTVLRVFPFWSSDQSRERIRPSLPPMLPKIADRLRRATDRAEREGLVLALEPEHATYGGSVSEVCAIIDAVGSPALQIAWDVNNGWYAEPIFPDAWNLVQGRVANVHVKEQAFLPEESRGRRMPTLLGAGVIPWPEVIARLRECGYQGLYSIETHFGSRGPYGWQKLKAATIYYMYALRELLEADAVVRS